MTIQFTIPGKPQGKARPRFNGKSGQVYTPQSTRDYEELIRRCYTQSSSKRMKFLETLPGTLSLRINAYFQVPKSWSVVKKQCALRGEIKPTVKPDIDNIAKIILDALNGVAYKDDAAIIGLMVIKYYTMQEPYVNVQICNNLLDASWFT